MCCVASSISFFGPSFVSPENVVSLMRLFITLNFLLISFDCCLTDCGTTARFSFHFIFVDDVWCILLVNLCFSECLDILLRRTSIMIPREAESLRHRERGWKLLPDVIPIGFIAATEFNDDHRHGDYIYTHRNTQTRTISGAHTHMVLMVGFSHSKWPIDYYYLSTLSAVDGHGALDSMDKYPLQSIGQCVEADSLRFLVFGLFRVRCCYRFSVDDAGLPS